MEEKYFCDWGCGQEAKYHFKSNRWCCSDHYSKCPERRRKTGLKSKGRKQPEWFKEQERQKMLNGKSAKMISIPRNPEKMKRMSEKTRERMLNGLSHYCQSFICKPSKQQVKLFNIVKNLYPDAKIERWDFDVNKRIDITIEEYKIAIEYDGSVWHLGKEYDNERQRLLENVGWKFIRYTDRIPCEEELKLDIENIINNEYKKLNDISNNGKLYVLVRKDLNCSSTAVQSGHCVAEFLLKSPLATTWNNQYLIYLEVENLKKLKNWIFKFEKKSINTYIFREPDMNNEITAICGYVEDDKSGFLNSLKLLDS